MRVGCDLPYFEDPGEIRAFARGVEALGFDHLGFSEHIVSARGTNYPDGFSPDDPWHETMTTLGFLAAVTTTIELCSAMLLLPLRSAVLAAKQAAEIDLLSNGRLRLGVALGWNREEVRALGVQPATRASRFEEQIEVLRALWTSDHVEFRGAYHDLDGVSLHPRPSRTIPIWMGAGHFGSGGVPGPGANTRMARLGDGWKMFAPLSFDLPRADAAIGALRAAVEAQGRNPLHFGIEARLAPQFVPEAEWAETVEHWTERGVSHLGLANRRGAGGVDQELARLERFATTTKHLWRRS